MLSSYLLKPSNHNFISRRADTILCVYTQQKGSFFEGKGKESLVSLTYGKLLVGNK